MKGLVPADAKCPYYEGFRWAEPDLDDLVAKFRHVFTHREEARAKGAAGRRRKRPRSGRGRTRPRASRSGCARSAPDAADRPASYTSAVTLHVPDDEWISARVEKARHEREMALAAAQRLEDEVQRLSYRVAELEADRVALKNRTEEAEAYVAAVKTSAPWRVIQWLRGLVGRKW